MNYSIAMEEIVVLDTLPQWEPPRRNILPDEVEEEPLEECWSCEELNFDN